MIQKATFKIPTDQLTTIEVEVTYPTDFVDVVKEYFTLLDTYRKAQIKRDTVQTDPHTETLHTKTV